MPEFKRDPNEIGCLWTHESPKGPWFSGTINGTKVVVFATNSTNPKAPTHRVLISKPKEGEPDREVHNANATPLPVDDDSIPF